MDSATSSSAWASEAAALPSGTVAFLFTDIEGSTVRWDRDPAAMQHAVRRHDELMKAIIAEHAGHVFKTIGDAFCAVFWHPSDALAAAVHAQRALAETDFAAVDGIEVRMALHVGSSDERDGDYFGPTLNRVARLLAIGHGGQVLISGSAAELADQQLPPGITLRDLGEHRLKDLTAPERVFQLLGAGLQAEFPKLRSLGLFDTNLPQQLSSFVGRENEIAEIERLLKEARLVTLFGAGGLGKTRCAQQVGAAVLEQFGDGVWFVDLASLGDPSLVPNEIAAIFAVRELPNRPMLETLTAHLERKHALLLLDNCEHLIGEAAKTAATILSGCPKIKIIATSREALKIAGEVVYQMPTLSVPGASGKLATDDALTYGAIALFDDRARTANNRFTLGDDNVAIVAEICRRLDGIPLAIELAAARMKALGPAQLARQLDERFRVLTGGQRTALPRQQTMRALIDWSYDLLLEQEQRLFRDLSVFAGSFSLEAAMMVCVSEHVGEFDVLDLLSSLIDKSLVLAEPSELETRYRLLESIRQYGREKSTSAGEFVALASRHAAAYAEIAEGIEHTYELASFERWLEGAKQELENVRAALAWSFGERGDTLVGQRLAATLRRVLVAFAAEARRWVTTALRTVTPSTPRQVAARLELCEATLASTMSQFRAALTAAERALELFEGLYDERGVANAQRWAGRSLVYLGQVVQGEALLRQSLITLRGLGFKRTGGILRDLGTARALQADVAGARALFEEALTRFRESDDEYNVAVTAGTLAEAEFRCGDAEAAVRAGREGLAAARARRLDTRVVAWLLCNVAAFCIDLGDYDAAREYAQEALELRHDAQIEIDVALALQHLAAIAALRPAASTRSDGDYRINTVRLLSFVDARLAELDVAREYTEQYLYDKVLAALRAGTESTAADVLRAEGSVLTEEQAVALALTI